MKHVTITPPLIDAFSIGQIACARIQAEIAREAMNRASGNAFRFRAYWPVQSAALDTIHHFAAQERQALAIIKKGGL